MTASPSFSTNFQAQTTSSLKADLRSLLLSMGKEAGNPGQEEELSAWFEALNFRTQEESVVVSFPHSFYRNWFEPQGKEQLEAAIHRLAGEDTDICYDVAGKREGTADGSADGSRGPSNPGKTGPSSPPDGPASVAPEPMPSDHAGRETGGFDTFFVGNKNQFAVSILREAAEGDGAYNPLFLKGPSGTGKTHLLGALTARQAARGVAVRRLTAADFASLFNQPPAARDQARNWLRSSIALCVDDIHLLARQPQAQEELASLIDTLASLGRPVACACFTPSSSSPFFGETEKLSPHLLSRLSMGMVLELAEPDLDVRLRYAQSRLADQNISGGRELPLLLARRCPDLRRLSGTVLRMAAFRAHTGQLPDDNDLDAILHAVGNPNALTPEAVLTMVATHCGLSSRDLRGARRDLKIVRARQVAMLLCRELLGESYPSLGRIFGGKDHSTVMHAVKKIRELQVTNKDVHNMVTELTQRCQTHLF